MTTNSDRFSPDEFEQWAENYDRDVSTQAQFPFDGYERVLDTVVRSADPQGGMRVLDIGTGTGNLAARFYQAGCELWCTDFSAAMLARARRKLPGAHFVLHDLRAAWPSELTGRFDRIVSAYVFHHFELEKKVELCAELTRMRLAERGRLVIADLSFPDKAAMEAFADSAGEAWEQEPYWLADESIKALKDAGLRPAYAQVSRCAGVYTFQA